MACEINRREINQPGSKTGWTQYRGLATRLVRVKPFSRKTPHHQARTASVSSYARSGVDRLSLNHPAEASAGGCNFLLCVVESLSRDIHSRLPLKRVWMLADPEV